MSTTEPVEVHSITGARDPHSQELNTRIRRYLISMGIRTICVVLAVVVPGPLRWVFIVGAIGLPYVAVIMANSVGSRGRSGAGPAPVTRVALPSQATPLTVDLGQYLDVENTSDRPRQSAEWTKTSSDERPR